MVTRTAEMTERAAQREIGPALRAAGGLLLGLAIVSAILWRQSADRTHFRQAAGSHPRAALASMPTAGGSMVTIYLVSSQEHAHSVAAQIDEANAQRLALGISPLPYVVLVLGLTDAHSTLPPSGLFDPALRGGTATQIVDLRHGS